MQRCADAVTHHVDIKTKRVFIARSTNYISPQEVEIEAEIAVMLSPTDKHYVETVSTRPNKLIEIVDYNPLWPAHFSGIADRIRAALPSVLAIHHVGSTSVFGLPAKAVIDIDLVVRDPTAEAEFVPALQAAGFQFLFREPNWHQHRFFGLEEPYANVHVWGPDAVKLIRHQRFREWLCAHPDDQERYVQAKRAAAQASRAAGESVMQYNLRKEPVIEDILEKAGVLHLGAVPEQEG
ncbi:GrpB family protein [Aspergillus clavatus NRRL 1]|uniref:GrpB domain protein n=1 Tax=Aspergillus clavatus (strain ATCC 1007 / CBS 513.65 / DSM 816 / NCTC 3887 / NRRL 1 / QM 1276 / 107) TaxID=344612 RepID=A1CSD9_ASPCL|nr:GrpB domain protein [Aspergillus clavatus NRRL 1]EAW08560.1 GrpB domain protein [Aspergillus clavatus NRRL 1]